ncbi:nucleotide exchange factor GrpE [Bacillus sp. DTU_2020_1000418_1_SI_GHA_SEK_038]|uniref:nucleotide exchange factor GrpE n=1 Tax=Bacillus sp. DTU_2020_1000418_1_SI_GHA_SEK_038 TaxID=3077585 RepID=UPI0028E4768D|nr:nucleotide exchange factor GrpE [Bacillus sp. DTU_2020_1000418_1_SI_GHA_SEK_038]WNS74355.1 nucleotide exchange factor GrpE [Bacillus sp. DTU_2020_1000418_1_SI_GHA_SEK_038]
MADEKNILEEESIQNSDQAEETEIPETETAAHSDETEAVNELSLEEQLVKAQEKTVELEAKLADMENRYYRLQADFDNSRRRARLDLESSEKYRAQKLISDLLPAIDNFERALQMESDNEQVKSVLQGMEMVYRSLLEALKNEGAEQIEAVGKEFDPQVHQAVMQVEMEGYGSNIVVEEFQKGYILKDRVIRPAMVKVNS